MERGSRMNGKRTANGRTPARTEPSAKRALLVSLCAGGIAVVACDPNSFDGYKLGDVGFLASPSGSTGSSTSTAGASSSSGAGGASCGDPAYAISQPVCVECVQASCCDKFAACGPHSG